MRYIISFLCATAAFPVMAEVPRVVTDIPPVHALVAQVIGDLGAPDLLLTKGASEHDFQLRPSQAAGLADAGLVVWIGPELTPWLDRALGNLGEGAVQLPLLQMQGTTLRSYGDGAEDGGHDHDHAGEAHAHNEHDHDEHAHDDHGAEEGHDHGDHAGHDHSGTDPHAWLDPANAQVWALGIAETLAQLDPQNAGAYRANAKQVVAEIAALDAEVAATLAPLAGTPLITQHDAYGYLAAHYGLTMADSIAAGDATAPGAAHLSDLRDRLAKGGTCLLPEAQHDPRQIEQLAAETGATLAGPLDPVGSTLEAGPGAYAALLRGLATTIAACNAG